VWCDVWLGNVLHVVIFCVHVVYVAQWVAVTVLGEVAHLSTIEAGSLGALVLVGLLLGVCCVAICLLHIDRVGVGVVSSVLASVVWGSSARQIHRDLNIVVYGLQCIGRIVLWPLLLLLLLLWPLLVLLGASSPGLWPELVLVLSKCVVKSSWIGDSSPGSDEFDHLSPFYNVDCLRLVLVVVLREWNSDDLV
jgi:hypothetical protein